MSRRSLDFILSISGLVMAVVLAVAGGLLLWGGSFANNTVHDQLVAQKISFGAASTLPANLQSYAGQQVTNGQQAKAYSDLIAVHLTKVAGGQTYSAGQLRLPRRGQQGRRPGRTAHHLVHG